MGFKLFGGLDSPDTLLARLAVVSSLDSAMAARMTEHVVTIMLLVPQSDRSEMGDRFTTTVSASARVGVGIISGSSTAHGSLSQPILPTERDEREQQQERCDVHVNELDMLNQKFFAQREMVSLGGVKVAQALTAIHTIAANIIKYDVSHDDAVEEIIGFGPSEEVALTIVDSICPHRSAIAIVLLNQTPLISFASFSLPCGDRTARCPILEKETTFGVRAFLRDQNGLASRRLFDIQLNEGRQVSLRQQQEVEQDSESPGADPMVVWKLRDGLEIHIPIQKARALLAELVVASETLRRAWRPCEVE